MAVIQTIVIRIHRILSGEKCVLVLCNGDTSGQFIYCVFSQMRGNALLLLGKARPFRSSSGTLAPRLKAGLSALLVYHDLRNL
ncbi:MAG: hypothetical protein IJ170_03105 [Ruminococcus sp.]|nr:hypothetical protein [Ruminococcus sp.]